MDNKQTEYHRPQFICYQAMKKKMIHQFPTYFAHIASIKHYNMPIPKIIYS